MEYVRDGLDGMDAKDQVKALTRLAEEIRENIETRRREQAEDHRLSKSCGHPEASIRNCPYQSEISGDDEQRCECCDDCAHECAMDI